MTQPNASLLKSWKRQRPEPNRNDALTMTPGANASGSLSPRQPQLAESLTHTTGTHAMQRTIFLAIVLLAFATHHSWAQAPAAEPTSTPPAPPAAISTAPVVPTIESDKNTELPLLVIEEPKAEGLRTDEFRQIIQLLVNRDIAKLVPPTDLGKLAGTHPTIAFTFLPKSDRDKIRRVLFEIRQINIPNLRVTIREHSHDEDGHPATEVRIPNYESIERTQVIALWRLFKQKRLNALFLSGKNNVAYAIPQFPDPVFGDETTEQIKVERGPAAVAYFFVRGTLKNEGPPCGLGYDEQTNTLLLDRRDGVTVQVTDLLNYWQKNNGPAPKPLTAATDAKEAGSLNPVLSGEKSQTQPANAELLEREMLRFVGRWRLISLSENRGKFGEHDGMTFTRKGNELEVTSLLNPFPPEPSIATLEVSDTPERIRRIKIVTKLPSGELKSMLAVYAITGVEGSNDNPLRLKMNFTRGKNYPTSLEERGEGIEQLECEYIPPSEGALGLPASAIPGKVWITSGTAIVAIADDGKSAAAYCEKHPTWVSIQLDPTITAQPTPVAGVFDVAVQHGPQCHAYSMSLGAWATLTLPAGEEAVANLGSFHGGISVHSKTQGEYVFKNEWGKWFSAEEIKAGKVVEHLAALKTKSGETGAPSVNITKVFPLQNDQAKAATELLKQLYDQTVVKIAIDPRTNAVIAIGPPQKLEEIEALLLKLDEAGTSPAKEGTRANPLADEAARLIAQLQVEIDVLLQDYGEEHPKVKELEVRLAAARKMAREAASANERPLSPRHELDVLMAESKVSQVETDAAHSHLERMLRLSNSAAVSQKEVNDAKVRDAVAAAKLSSSLTRVAAAKDRLKADVLNDMETALAELEKLSGPNHPLVRESEAKFKAIIEKFDQSPDEAQREAHELVSQFVAATVKTLESDIAYLQGTIKAGGVPEFISKITAQLEDVKRQLAIVQRQQRARKLLASDSLAALPESSSPSDTAPVLGAQQPSPQTESSGGAVKTSGLSSAELKQQIAKLRSDYEAAEARAHMLAEQLRQPGNTASKDELKKTVEEAFKLRQSLLRAELSEMLDRLAKTQQSIDLRDRITDQIVSRRVEDLLNPQLKWGDSKSGTQPAPPSASPKESAPSQPQEWTAKLQGHWQLMQHTYEPVDTSDGKKPQPGDVKRENWNPETYYRKQTIPWKAMFDGHQMSICKEDGSDPMTFELTFLKAGPPQQVNLTLVLNEEQIAEFKRNAEESQSPMEIPAFISIIEETPDGFRMCLDLKAKGTRPFLFVLGPDTGLWEFRREATAPTAPPKESAQLQPQDWTAKLQGPWLMEFTGFDQVKSADGKKTLTDEKGGAIYHKKTTTRKVVVDGNLMTVSDLGGQESATCELVFVDAGPPQQVDLIEILNEAAMAQLVKNLGGSSNPIEFLTSRGIIAETADGFQLCIKDGGEGNRPSLFVMGPETTLFEFRRPTTLPQKQAADQEVLPLTEGQPSENNAAKTSQLTAEQLNLLYRGILQRSPTEREKEAWLNAILKGHTTEKAIWILLASDPLFERVGRGKSAFVSLLHQTLLGRKPTEDELKYLTDSYDESKGDRKEVVLRFWGTVGPSAADDLLSRLAAAQKAGTLVASDSAAPASEPSPKDATGKKRNALVATQDIPAGYPLTDFNVVMVEIPASIQVPEGGEFVQTHQEYEQRSLRMSVPSGSLIRKADLGERGVFNASNQIPKGMRINTFPVTDTQTHSGMLKPDDRVDVKVGYTTPKGIVEVKTLLESVRVFACEDKTVKGENGQPVLRSRFVTLLVTPEQDGYLEIAKMKGQLSLSLRNPDDDELVNRHGLNTAFLKELKHVKGPGEPSSQVAVSELDGDWHLVSWDDGGRKSRFAANMTIHGDQYSSSKQKTGSKGQITIDTKAKTVLWSNMEFIPSMPAEVPPVPSGWKGIYELNEDRLTIRSQDGPDLFVWGRGLCDLRAAKSPPDGMALFPLRDVKSPADLGQFTPGDKVDVSAEWELPDGSRSTGLVAELVEIDGVMYGDPESSNAVMLLGTPDQVKLIEAVWVRSKLTLVARKAGDEGFKLSGGMNASVLTEIQAAAGADPVTPLEGDWYLESLEVNGDIIGDRTNITIRGDVWSKEFLIGDNYGDTKKLTGILRINKKDHSYVISEWPQLGLAQMKDGARYHVDENGTFEMTGDKLIMKGRELPEHATLTRTWGRGHRPFVPPLSSVSETRKLRWRSGIVEIFQIAEDSLDKVKRDDVIGHGLGVFVSPDGLIMAHVKDATLYFDNPGSYPLHAKLDDGSFVNLTPIEDAKNGWLALRAAEKELRVNHFFPIATTPTAIADQMYVWGRATSPPLKFDVFDSKVMLIDRRAPNSGERVWQLLKPEDWRQSESLPVLTAEGELLALTMPDTGDLVLALPASRLKAMFPKSFPATTEPQAAPAEATKPAATP